MPRVAHLECIGTCSRLDCSLLVGFEEIRIHQFILSKGVYGDLRMKELKPVSYYVHASTSPLSN
jgi:hypothetical protein